VSIHYYKRFLLQWKQLWLFALLCLASWAGFAQTIYGAGDNTGGLNRTQLFAITPASGAVTRVCNTTTFQFTTTAIGVLNTGAGQVVYIQRGGANPLINTFNPATCTNGTAVATTLPANIVRATACPDGRFYAMADSSLQVFDINPTTGVTNRTLTFTGLTQEAISSGDFACTSNGDIYVLVDPLGGGVDYRLYSAASNTFQTAPSGSNVALTERGPIGAGIVPNGLSEAPNGLAGCAAAPNPCLIASTGTLTYKVSSTSGLFSNPVGHTAGLTDLSRNFPLNVSSVKNATPTTVPQGGTLTYTINVANSGPGVVGTVNVIDNFTPGAYSSINWTCGVIAAGSATLVTTACGAASGTGNINQTASLSINGQLRYTISAVLSNTFTGILSNVGNATVSVNFLDLTPTNNVSTATLTVAPAALLSVTKTDGIGTTTAGGTVTYTVTFVNSGPGAANNARIQDLPGAGLSACTALTCAPAGGAVCPAPIANLIAPSSTTVATFPPNSTLTFTVRCRVSATGLP
jgi:uncharacterized repeat protein (TIGR01451 family)